MCDPPAFADLIISRPRSAPRAVRRFTALGLATVVYSGAIAALVLAHLLVVEMVTPPEAGFDPIPVFRVPAGSGGGLRPPVGGRGGGPRGGELTPAPAIHPGALRPVVVPLAPPAVDADLPETPTASSAGPPEDLGWGRGGDGTGVGPECNGCTADGPGDGVEDGQEIADKSRFDAADPRITPPILIPSTRALPAYPALARLARVEGTVWLLIVIERDGRVGEVEVTRSPDPRYGFDLAAIEAVKRWRYRPAVIGGRPVAVQASVIVEFTISR